MTTAPLHQAHAAQPAPSLDIRKGARNGNWQEFDVNGHSGMVLVVARMEDDEVDYPLGQQVEQLLLTASKPAQPASRDDLTDAQIINIAIGAGVNMRTGRGALRLARAIISADRAQPERSKETQ